MRHLLNQPKLTWIESNPYFHPTREGQRERIAVVGSLTRFRNFIGMFHRSLPLTYVSSKNQARRFKFTKVIVLPDTTDRYLTILEYINTAGGAVRSNNASQLIADYPADMHVHLGRLNTSVDIETSNINQLYGQISVSRSQVNDVVTQENVDSIRRSMSVGNQGGDFAIEPLPVPEYDLSRVRDSMREAFIGVNSWTVPVTADLDDLDARLSVLEDEVDLDSISSHEDDSDDGEDQGYF